MHLFLIGNLTSFATTKLWRNDSTIRFKRLIVPVAFKTPEMGLALGLSTSVTFKTTYQNDTTIRTSYIQAIGFLTTRRQNIQALESGIYFKDENYILNTQAAHTYFPDKFWGIGNDLSPHPFSPFTYEQVYLSPHLKRKLFGRFYLGALYEIQYLYRILYAKGSVYDSFKFYGKDPYKVSGFGLSLSYDTRNSAFWPSKGLYFLSQLTDFNKVFFSDYNMRKWITDVRYFKTIVKNQILALQFYNYETIGKVPIKELAAFGGPNNMRGFYQGRYRDLNMFSIISEYRIHLRGRFSSCIFGGFGNVYHSFSSATMRNMKFSAGAGLRFAVLEKEKLNIRLDYGYSNHFDQGLYITFGECF
jgi:outer membrane protein assembly factor BamA